MISVSVLACEHVRGFVFCHCASFSPDSTTHSLHSHFRFLSHSLSRCLPMPSLFLTPSLLSPHSLSVFSPFSPSPLFPSTSFFGCPAEHGFGAGHHSFKSSDEKVCASGAGHASNGGYSGLCEIGHPYDTPEYPFLPGSGGGSRGAKGGAGGGAVYVKVPGRLVMSGSVLARGACAETPASVGQGGSGGGSGELFEFENRPF